MDHPLDNKSYPYTQFFCEENIWWLAKRLTEEGADSNKLFAVFIVNAIKAVPILNQKASKASGELMYWDYHVVMEQQFEDGRRTIWDFDSRLGMPCEKQRYIEKSFLPEGSCPNEYLPIFRRVRADAYHQKFTSDRHHMLDAKGKPIVSFPTYSALKGEASSPVTLLEYLDLGHVIDGVEDYSLYDYLRL